MSPILAIAVTMIVASTTLALAQQKKLDGACPAISIAIDDALVSKPSATGSVPCGVQDVLRLRVTGEPLRLAVNAVDTTDEARSERGYPKGVAAMRVTLDGKWAVTDVVPTTAHARVIELEERNAGEDAKGVFVTEIRAMFPRRADGTETMPWDLQPDGMKGTPGAPQRNLAATLWPVEAAASVVMTVSVGDFRRNRVVQPLGLTLGQ